LNHYSFILEGSKLFIFIRKGTLINLSFVKLAKRRIDGVYVIMQDGYDGTCRCKGKPFLEFVKYKSTAYLSNTNSN
jgi:hypothetical protein